jgi:hypothetical protein
MLSWQTFEKCKLYWQNLFFLDICYLRLDFESFAILGPADSSEVAGGACRDTLILTVSKFYEGSYNLKMLKLISEQGHTGGGGAGIFCNRD